MDGWNTTFLLGRPIFRCYVSFREGIPSAGASKLAWLEKTGASDTDCESCASFMELLLPRNLTCGPSKMIVGTRYFPFWISIIFQGQVVKLQECRVLVFSLLCCSSLLKPDLLVDWTLLVEEYCAWITSCFSEISSNLAVLRHFLWQKMMARLCTNGVSHPMFEPRRVHSRNLLSLGFSWFLCRNQPMFSPQKKKAALDDSAIFNELSPELRSDVVPWADKLLAAWHFLQRHGYHGF